jgi:hypothetical protein
MSREPGLTTMTNQTKRINTLKAVDCRVYERYPSVLQTSCQPIAARGELKWPGVIRDFSGRGLGLLLRRRFEPGTGLVVELPGKLGDMSVFARVVHATAQADGYWMLGCTLLTELTDEALNELL